MVGCYRCGAAVRVREEHRHRQNFCTEQCRIWHRREFMRSGRSILRDERRRKIAATPLHEMYPEMLPAIDRVQRRRPSYDAWNRSQGGWTAAGMALLEAAR